MIDHKLIRVEPNDPHRCQSGGKLGQCPYRAAEGNIYCQRHGGNKAIQAKEAENLRTYKLSIWQNRKNELADDDKIKSLREEIALARMMVEQIVNKCETDVDLILNSSKIADLLMKIDKLVNSCNAIETKMGMLLDRSSIIHIGSMIVEVVAQFIAVPEDREAAALQILDVVTNTIVKKDE